MSYAYEAMMINEMVGQYYTLGSQLAGGHSSLHLPIQSGANLLSQQGLCAHYDERIDTAESDRCDADFNIDVFGVWVFPVALSVVAYALLAFVVRYRR
jgi:hypothetical protein